MNSPETLELEAVDAALAGRYVAPEHAELADLALLLRDDRPEPTPAWATHLDRRVESGFPARPKKRRNWTWLRTAAPIGAVASLLLIIVVVGALSGGESDDSGGGGGGSAGVAASDQAQTTEAAPETASGGASGGVSRDSAGPVEQLSRPRKQERSVSMTLAAKRRQIDPVANQIGDIAADLGGYVARSSISSGQGGDMQLKVPTRRLDTLVQRVSKLAKVRGLSRNSQDITAVVVSARDRLNDARAERKSLLRQLANAVTVNETESIRARLRIVSREIAFARNSLHRANNRANFADVAVTLVATRGSSDEGGAWTPGDAWHDALRVLEVVAGVAVIAAAIAVPLLIAWLLGWLARRGVTRRRRERALDMA